MNKLASPSTPESSAGRSVYTVMDTRLIAILLLIVLLAGCAQNEQNGAAPAAPTMAAATLQALNPTVQAPTVVVPTVVKTTAVAVAPSAAPTAAPSGSPSAVAGPATEAAEVQGEPGPKSFEHFDGHKRYIIPSRPEFSVVENGDQPRGVTVSAWVRLSSDTFQATDGGVHRYVMYLVKQNPDAPRPVEWGLRVYDSRNEDESPGSDPAEQEAGNRLNRQSGYVFNETAGRGTGSYVAYDARNPEDRTFRFLTLRIDPVTGTTAFFLDGQKVDEDKYRGDGVKDPVTPTMTDAPIVIGGQGHGAFEGDLGDISIYGQALDDDQIRDLFAHGVVNGLDPALLLRMKDGDAPRDESPYANQVERQNYTPK